tara:strand:- start:422 stop:880 length:459 start_codon:yes stop_codon:yes gene_type:complete
MADLTTTVTESVVLNGAIRGNSNSVTTTGITQVFETIVTCAHSQETTVASFNTAAHSVAGAINLPGITVRYVRLTNLDTEGTLTLAVITGSSNYQVTLTPGNSHILCLGLEVAEGEADVTPAFGTLQDLRTLVVKPTGVLYNPQVGVFVGME